MRRRRADTIGRKSIAKIMADAHRQDFEKRRKPAAGEGRRNSRDRMDEGDDEGLHTDEEEDDDDSGSMLEERMAVREAEGLGRRGGKGSDTE